MIRVNLLAVERERAKRRTGFQLAQKVTVACSLIVVVAVLGILWWWWALNKQVEAIDAEIAAANREITRLGAIDQQVRQFEQRRTQLQQRVTLIEELRKGQSAPVHMLDEISKSVPDLLWLTELRQAGNDLTLNGRCSTLTALSDFVGNLEASGYFKKPVEILDSQVDSQGAGKTEVIRFSVKAQFSGPGA